MYNVFSGPKKISMAVKNYKQDIKLTNRFTLTRLVPIFLYLIPVRFVDDFGVSSVTALLYYCECTR